MVSQDNYYIDRDQQPVDDKGIQNFDTPGSIDLELYTQDVTKLLNHEKVTKKEYTFNNPDIAPKVLEFTPAPILVVEGIFVLSFPDLANLIDLKLFIDAKDHVRLKRRIVRDNEERGYDLDDVLYRYENHVMPSYEKYIEPFKLSSDIVIPNDDNFDEALAVIVAFLRSKLT